MQSQLTHSRGFTIVELMIVVALIGIISTLAYPSMTSQIANMRIKSAKNSIVEAVREAQAQSMILRKPIWIVVENSNDNFSLILTDTDPDSGAVAADKVISKTMLPKSIRILNSSGAVIDTKSDLRVTQSGSFQIKSSSNYAPATYAFYVCDTIYSGNVSTALKFQNRSTPVPQNATSESIVCSL